MRHGAVVGHGDDERILGNAKFFKGIPQCCNVGLDDALILLADHAALDGHLFRFTDEGHPQWPPGNVKGLLRLSVAPDKAQGALAGLDVEVLVVLEFLGAVAPFFGLFSFLALQIEHIRFILDESAVTLIWVIGKQFLFHPDDGVAHLPPILL